MHSRSTWLAPIRYFLSLIIVCCLLPLGCGGDGGDTVPHIVSITISSDVVALQVGESIQLGAKGTYSNNHTQDITDEVSWASSNELIATVNGAGLLSALYGGEVTIFAYLNNVNASVDIDINAVTWMTSIIKEYALEAECIRQTSDGGYILTGRQQQEDQNWDIYLSKLNEYGNILWETTYGSSGDDTGNSVSEVNTTYVVAGQIATSETTSDVYLVCTDGMGNMLWEKTYGGPYNDVANAIQTTTDGDLIIAGSTEKESDTLNNLKDFDIYLVKTDQNGALIWERTIVDPFEGYDSDDIARSVRQVSDGGYIIAGSIHNVNVFDNFYVLRIDDSGAPIWQQSIGEGWSYENGYDVVEASLGGYIVVGSINSELGADEYGCLAVRFDSDGNQEWGKNYFSMVINYNSRYAVAPASDMSGYAIAGVAYGWSTGSKDISLFKINDNGEILWERIYGDQSKNYGVSLQETSDGGYIVATNSESEESVSILILKTNENGDVDGLEANPD